MNEKTKHNNADLNNEYFTDKSKNMEQNKKIKKENIISKKNNANSLSNKQMNLKEKEHLNLKKGYKNTEPINIPSLNINSPKNMISRKTYGESKINDSNIKDKNKEYLNNNILKGYLDKSNIINNKLKEEIKKLNKELSLIKNNGNVNSNLVNENNSNNLNEVKIKFGKLKDETVQLKKTIENQNNIIAKIKKEKKILEEDLIKEKKYITNKNDEVDNLNNKCKELILLMNELKNKNFFIEKEKLNEIKVFKEKIEDLEMKNKNENEEKNILLMKIEKQTQQINTLEKNINELNDKIKGYENNKNDKILLGSLNSINLSNANDSINNIKEREVIIFNSDLKDNEEKNKIFGSIEVEENNENNSKRPSTPSFKCPNFEEKESYSDLNNLNENDINQNNDIKLDEKNNNVNNMDNINEEKYDIKYYKNQYMHYCKLFQEYKNKYELLEKSKNENEELNKKENNTRINTNNNNLISSLSSIKLNNQYSPNEYFILCDKKYKQLKWYLLKKQSEYENDDAYENLLWVASPYLTDLDKFNEYSIDEEPDNTEMINIIKKLEEKENIISKLSYKLEKLERQFEQNKSMNSNADGENDKKKNKNKIFNYFDENLFSDNSIATSFRKYSFKDKKSKSNIVKTEGSECVVTLDKYNIILEKLNHTEAQFAKLQKENMELRKNKQFYLSQNNNIVNIIPNNDNDKEKNDNENNCIINFSSDINKLTLMGNNFINNINDDGLGLLKSTQKEENVNYKIKFINLEKKINLLKEQCKNILIKLKIPKKDKEEIKRMLEYFDYTNDEILMILGDKKNKK